VSSVLSGEGRIIVQSEANKPVKVLVYVPLEVARDSQFPFHNSGPVNVWVDSVGGKLLISPMQS